MLNPMDEATLRAVARLEGSDDWQIFVDYLNHERKEMSSNNAYTEQEHTFRQMQGAGQTLDKLLTQISGASGIVRKL